MKFGIWSNGFRPHRSAHECYEEDIAEIVLADQLGLQFAYISEHHGEKPYINAVDTIPVPELMMAKAAGLTKQIKMGAAVKLIHLYHPLDVAIQATVTEHLLGEGRYIFGFGSGFPLPLFSDERGLTYDDRHDRLRESLEFIEKCWASDQPFDWDGEHWQAKGVIALPKPVSGPAIPMAIATETEASVRMAAQRGMTLLSAFLEPAAMVHKKAATYTEHANPRQNIASGRIIYVADSREQALDDLRKAVAFEVSIQNERGFLKMLDKLYGVKVPPTDQAIEALVEAELYIVGSPDEVAELLSSFWHDTGGFGTLLYITGKDWADRERRHKSLRLFKEAVVPHLEALEPSAETAAAAE
jgi:alkanesulfonate monooxygenase SsuD/methylene tetrahydromethanopterin reductase-like flavin-dependent oxidoreductase (luciferase family)